jgi:3-oxoacyl-[acyl-carrier-protein] synthase II
VKRVVVTGVGAVTPLGPDVASTWAALLEGRSAVGPITRFDASGFDTRFAAQADDVPHLSGRWEAAASRARAADLLDRKTRLLLSAAQEALAQARLVDAQPNPERVAVCLGSEGGRKLLEDVAERTVRVGRIQTLEPAIPHLPPGEYARARPSHPTRLLADIVGARGPMRTVVTACTSAGGALAEALYLLRTGAADVALAGGTDTLVEAFMVSGFSLLGALSTRNDDPATASRPFDREREGFVLGEGAGLLVLETEQHAAARGATVLGRLLGAGLSNNAYRITDSPPEGTGPEVSMKAAMVDAGIAPHEVGYINAHGTSTIMNDLSETRGIRRAFGDAADQLVVTSTKSMMGHLVAACGAVEAIVTLCSLRDGIVHGTANLVNPDPECDLDYAPGQARRVPGLKVALSNSFGFGGSNATLVLGAP